MHNWTIQRYCLAPSFSLGALSLDGAPPGWFTLEDTMREIIGEPVEKWKLPTLTAIPTGRYRLIMDDSVRFQRKMPHILDVPGFTGIRMHGFGVEASVINTDGCPLLGYGANIMTGKVQNSLAAAAAFYDRLTAALADGENWINVRNPDI